MQKDLSSSRIVVALLHIVHLQPVVWSGVQGKQINQTTAALVALHSLWSRAYCLSFLVDRFVKHFYYKSMDDLSSIHVPHAMLHV